MNKDEANRTRAFREVFPDDTEPRGWAEHYFEVGYEAGQRAERERIAEELIGKAVEIRDDPSIQIQSLYFEAGHTAACTKIIDVIIELRTEPAESGE